MTKEEVVKMLKSKMDGHTDTSYEWAETVRMAIKALEQEPCEDAISRQAVIDTIDKWVKSMHVLIALPANEVTPLFESVHELPSVTPQPKMGKWSFTKHYGRDYYVCSFCGMERMDDHSSGWNYCPNCGAKMQEVEENEKT